MNRIQVEKLLASKEKSEEEKAAKLLNWFHKNPGIFSNVVFPKKRSIFHELVKQNLSATLDSLLADENIKPYAFRTDAKNRTVLHSAARSKIDNTSMAAIVLSRLPELLNAQDLHGNTALHTAVFSGNPRIAELLINQLNINCLLLNHQSRSALHYAAQNSECASKMLSIMQERMLSKVNAVDFEGNSALHHAVFKNSVEAVTSLLQYPDLSCLTPNHKGQTVLHLAAQNCEDNPLLSELLVTRSPELLNMQDLDGNTALHIAVIHKNCQIVLKLVSFQGINRSIPNYNNLPPAMLPETDDRLRQALMHIDLSPVKKLDTSFLELDTAYCESLDINYPLLSSSSSRSSDASYSSDSWRSHRRTLHAYASSSSSSSRSLSSSSSSFSGSLSPDSASSSRPYIMLTQSQYGSSLHTEFSESSSHSGSYTEKEEISGINIRRLLENLINEYSDQTPTARYLQLERQFLMVCNNLDLKPFFHTKPTESPNLPVKGLFTILDSLIFKLYPMVQEQFATYCADRQQLRIEFVQLLFINGLDVATERISVPDFSKTMNRIVHKSGSTEEAYRFDTPDGMHVLESLWFIASGKTNKDSKQKICINTINHQALGYLYLYDLSLETCLSFLCGMYPEFDTQQKLVVNFFVWQLLNHHVEKGLVFTPDIIEQLGQFTQLNTHEDWGFDIGMPVNALFHELVKTIEGWQHNTLALNYRFMNEWIRSSEIYTQECFDDLVQTAVSKNNKDREPELFLLADEFRTATRLFYKHLPLHDFKPGEKSGPALRLQTDYFNKLNQYFTSLLLAQDASSVIKVLKFLVQLIQELFCTKGGISQDQNHLMILSSVLNDVSISRLTKYFELLNKTETGSLGELKSLVSPNKNCQALREGIKNAPLVLPFPGLLLTDIEFATGPANPDWVVKAELAGEILLNLLRIKESLQLQPGIYRTDLRSHLTKLPVANPDSTYYTSIRRFQLRSNDKLIISSATKWSDWDALLDSLSGPEWLGNHVIPLLVNEGEEIPANCFECNLMENFIQCIPRDTLLTNEELNTLLSIVSKAGTVLFNLRNTFESYYMQDYPLAKKSRRNQTVHLTLKVLGCFNLHLLSKSWSPDNTAQFNVALDSVVSTLRAFASLNEPELYTGLLGPLLSGYQITVRFLTMIPQDACFHEKSLALLHSLNRIFSHKQIKKSVAIRLLTGYELMNNYLDSIPQESFPIERFDNLMQILACLAPVMKQLCREYRRFFQRELTTYADKKQEQSVALSLKLLKSFNKTIPLFPVTYEHFSWLLSSLGRLTSTLGSFLLTSAPEYYHDQSAPIFTTRENHNAILSGLITGYKLTFCLTMTIDQCSSIHDYRQSLDLLHKLTNTLDAFLQIYFKFYTPNPAITPAKIRILIGHGDKTISAGNQLTDFLVAKLRGLASPKYGEQVQSNESLLLTAQTRKYLNAFQGLYNEFYPELGPQTRNELYFLTLFREINAAAPEHKNLSKVKESHASEKKGGRFGLFGRRKNSVSSSSSPVSPVISPAVTFSPSSSTSSSSSSSSTSPSSSLEAATMNSDPGVTLRRSRSGKMKRLSQPFSSHFAVSRKTSHTGESKSYSSDNEDYEDDKIFHSRYEGADFPI